MRIVLGCLLCVLAIGTRASGFTITEVQPGVYLHQGVHEQMVVENYGDIANVGFIVGSEAVAVVDPGGSDQTGQQLRKAIESVTDLPIKHVVLTHFHPDHVIGATAFADVPNIVAHKNYPRAIVQRGEFYAERFKPLFGEGNETIFTAPTHLVSEEYSIDLGGRQLLINAHPTGHTDNDLTVVDVNTNTLWASDLVFAQRTPSLDGNLSGWLRILETLSKRNFQMIIPGHGTPGDWESTASLQQEYLIDLKTRVKQQIDEGLALSAVIKRAEERGDSVWLLFEQQHPTNLTKAYTELEWD